MLIHAQDVEHINTHKLRKSSLFTFVRHVGILLHTNVRRPCFILTLWVVFYNLYFLHDQLYQIL